MQFKVRDRRTEKRYFVDNVIIRGYGWIIGPIGIAVYNGLCVHADIDTQECQPSHQKLADLLGISKTPVKRYLKLLRELGLIGWRARVVGDAQIPHEYVLLDPPDPPDVDVYVYPDYMRLKPKERPVSREVGYLVPQVGHEEPQVGREKPEVGCEVPTNNPHVTIPIEQQKAAGATLYKGYAYVVTHFPEDLTFDCPNPECGKTSITWPKRRTGFVCPHCQAALAGFELGNDEKGEPDWKPPPKAVPDSEKRILGNLIPRCPPHLAGFPYYERDKQEILRVHGRDPILLMHEVDYQCEQYLKKRGRRDQVVHNGMVSARNKLGATRKESDATQTSRDPPAAQAPVGGVPIWGGRAPPQPSEVS